MKNQKLPQIDSIQELAQFWDTHDLADFEDELEVAEETIFAPEGEITVHLDREDVQAVRRLAQSEGIGEADLIQKWVQEKIR